MPAKPDYGVDAPNVIRNLLVIGVGVAAITTIWHTIRVGPVTFILFPSLYVCAASFLLPGILMLVYAKYGKFRHRDRMLGYVSWRGDEQVLDVGTGRGLLLVGAA